MTKKTNDRPPFYNKFRFMRLVIMKGLFILIVSFILFGCSKNYLFRRDNIAISEEMKRIIEEDQNVRNQIAPIHKKYKLRTFNTVIDSIADLGLDHIPDGRSEEHTSAPVTSASRMPSSA